MARLLFLQKVQYEFVGVMSISAYLKRAGHQVDLLFKDEEKNNFFPKIKAYDPDLVAFSSMTGEHTHYLEIATEVKKNLDVPILMGGPHTTFFPEVINHTSVDIICRGEGEEAAVELCDRLDGGQDYRDVRNLWVKQNGTIFKNDIGPGENNLDNYPIQDREIYYKYKYLREYPTKPFVTARGCPYQCSYCFNREYNQLYHGKAKVLRRYSVKRVIEEILQVKRHYPLKRVLFNDDIFVLDKSWLEEFVPLYKREVGLPFACNFHINIANEELVRLLKEAGCYLACFGIESGDQELRKLILKRNTTDEQIYQTASLFRKHDIKMKTFNMLGLPGETLKQALKTVRINANIKTDYPWCSILQPYPHTEIAAIAQEKGLLKKDFSLDDLESSYFFKSVFKQPNIRQLTRLQKLFFFGVRMPWTIPIIAWMVKIPFDKLYILLFGLSYTLRVGREFHLGWSNALRFALRHRKNL